MGSFPTYRPRGGPKPGPNPGPFLDTSSPKSTRKHSKIMNLSISGRRVSPNHPDEVLNGPLFGVVLGPGFGPGGDGVVDGPILIVWEYPHHPLPVPARGWSGSAPERAYFGTQKASQAHDVQKMDPIFYNHPVLGCLCCF